MSSKEIVGELRELKNLLTKSPSRVVDSRRRMVPTRVSTERSTSLKSSKTKANTDGYSRVPSTHYRSTSARSKVSTATTKTAVPKAAASKPIVVDNKPEKPSGYVASKMKEISTKNNDPRREERQQFRYKDTFTDPVPGLEKKPMKLGDLPDRILKVLDLSSSSDEIPVKRQNLEIATSSSDEDIKKWAERRKKTAETTKTATKKGKKKTSHKKLESSSSSEMSLELPRNYKKPVATRVTKHESSSSSLENGSICKNRKGNMKRVLETLVVSDSSSDEKPAMKVQPRKGLVVSTPVHACFVEKEKTPTRPQLVLVSPSEPAQPVQQKKELSRAELREKLAKLGISDSSSDDSRTESDNGDLSDKLLSRPVTGRRIVEERLTDEDILLKERMKKLGISDSSDDDFIMMNIERMRPVNKEEEKKEQSEPAPAPAPPQVATPPKRESYRDRLKRLGIEYSSSDDEELPPSKISPHVSPEISPAPKSQVQPLNFMSDSSSEEEQIAPMQDVACVSSEEESTKERVIVLSRPINISSSDDDNDSKIHNDDVCSSSESEQQIIPNEKPVIDSSSSDEIIPKPTSNVQISSDSDEDVPLPKADELSNEEEEIIPTNAAISSSSEVQFAEEEAKIESDTPISNHEEIKVPDSEGSAVKAEIPDSSDDEPYDRAKLEEIMANMTDSEEEDSEHTKNISDYSTVSEQSAKEAAERASLIAEGLRANASHSSTDIVVETNTEELLNKQEAVLVALGVSDASEEEEDIMRQSLILKQRLSQLEIPEYDSDSDSHPDDFFKLTSPKSPISPSPTKGDDSDADDVVPAAIAFSSDDEPMHTPSAPSSPPTGRPMPKIARIATDSEDFVHKIPLGDALSDSDSGKELDDSIEALKRQIANNAHINHSSSIEKPAINSDYGTDSDDVNGLTAEEILRKYDISTDGGEDDDYDFDEVDAKTNEILAKYLK